MMLTFYCRGTIVSLKNENSKLLEELKILELSSQDKARNSFNKLAAIKSEQAGIHIPNSNSFI